ncbi:hypothetical protein DFH08DRAFT_811488 [Mycena albidolilacea]|uniref:Uncharacterized protein n=1 Tax=Mycena albidolilacea TaxID=1033008 RepID=A0AAD7ENR3_9AGAR|nr:hypothetical protein DFH08DRAFT_811488 [Mycena albidolilacea]
MTARVTTTTFTFSGHWEVEARAGASRRAGGLLRKGGREAVHEIITDVAAGATFGVASLLLQYFWEPQVHLQKDCPSYTPPTFTPRRRQMNPGAAAAAVSFWTLWVPPFSTAATPFLLARIWALHYGVATSSARTGGSRGIYRCLVKRDGIRPTSAPRCGRCSIDPSRDAPDVDVQVFRRQFCSIDGEHGTARSMSTTPCNTLPGSCVGISLLLESLLEKISCFLCRPSNLLPCCPDPFYVPRTRGSRFPSSNMAYAKASRFVDSASTRCKAVERDTDWRYSANNLLPITDFSDILEDVFFEFSDADRHFENTRSRHGVQEEIWRQIEWRWAVRGGVSMAVTVLFGDFLDYYSFDCRRNVEISFSTCGRRDYYEDVHLWVGGRPWT